VTSIFQRAKESQSTSSSINEVQQEERSIFKKAKELEATPEIANPSIKQEKKLSTNALPDVVRETLSGFGSLGDIFQSFHMQPAKQSEVQRQTLEREYALPESERSWGTEESEYSRLPTSQEIKRLLPESEVPREEMPAWQKALGRGGRLLTGGVSLGLGPLASLIPAAGGALTGQVAEESGLGEFGQGVAEVGGQLGPSLFKAGQRFFKTTGDVTKSGLPKLRATESKLTKYAAISPETKEKTLEKLEKSASELTRKTLKEKLPISEKIASGFDFEKRYEQEFGKIKSLAKRANPLIETNPVNELMKKNYQEFRTLLEPDTEVKNIINTSKKWLRRQPSSLKEMLDIYRSNNRKLKQIYETSGQMGRREMYKNFLIDYNRSIGQSIENTLPKDSKFVKMFKDMNAEYSQYKKGLQAEKELSPLLNSFSKPNQLKKLAESPKIKSKLMNSLGEDGANQIVSIADDLQKAKEAVSGIKGREWTKELHVLAKAGLLGLHVPYAKTGIFVHTMYHLSKQMLGRVLINPSSRNAYQEALRAMAEGNKEEYIMATRRMFEAINENESHQEEY
jgi:hypothetical protein